MGITQLKQHEHGILDIFEGDRQLARYLSHNNNIAKHKSYQRLHQDQYLDIFDHTPSFNEKKAFVGVFRKKWKEDKGYCSLFDKLRNVRLAKSMSIDVVERRTRTR